MTITEKLFVHELKTFLWANGISIPWKEHKQPKDRKPTGRYFFIGKDGVRHSSVGRVRRKRVHDFVTPSPHTGKTGETCN